MLYRYIVCVYVYACVLVGINRKHKSLQIGVVRGGTLTILQIFYDRQCYQGYGEWNSLTSYILQNILFTVLLTACFYFYVRKCCKSSYRVYVF